MSVDFGGGVAVEDGAGGVSLFGLSGYRACFVMRRCSRLMASVCRMEPEAEGLLRAAMHDLHLSARAYDRILKVARTVADLAEAEWIGSVHVAEAVGYRLLDRPFS